jgi:hypothetical protein
MTLALADVQRQQSRREARAQAANQAHELAAVQSLADRLAASRRREALLEKEIDELEAEVQDLEAEISKLRALLARQS